MRLANEYLIMLAGNNGFLTTLYRKLYVYIFITGNVIDGYMMDGK